MEDEVTPIVRTPEAYDDLIKDGDALLQHTQRMRLMILDQVGLSGDPKDVASAARLLDGLDKQEISVRRLKVDQQAVDTTAAAQQIMQSILNELTHNPPGRGQRTEAMADPVLELNEGEESLFDFEDGSLALGTQDTAFEDFQKQHMQK